MGRDRRERRTRLDQRRRTGRDGPDERRARLDRARLDCRLWSGISTDDEETTRLGDPRGACLLMLVSMTTLGNETSGCARLRERCGRLLAAPHL